MKYIVNLTLSEDNENINDVQEWLVNVGKPVATNSESGVCDSRLLKIIEIPGDPDLLKESVNISLQLEFDTREAANDWIEDYMTPVLEGYMTRFERQPLFFVTVLESI